MTIEIAGIDLPIDYEQIFWYGFLFLGSTGLLPSNIYNVLFPIVSSVLSPSGSILAGSTTSGQTSFNTGLIGAPNTVSTIPTPPTQTLYLVAGGTIHTPSAASLGTIMFLQNPTPNVSTITGSFLDANGNALTQIVLSKGQTVSLLWTGAAFLEFLSGYG